MKKFYYFMLSMSIMFGSISACEFDNQSPKETNQEQTKNGEGIYTPQNKNDDFLIVPVLIVPENFLKTGKDLFIIGSTLFLPGYCGFIIGAHLGPVGAIVGSIVGLRIGTLYL